MDVFSQQVIWSWNRYFFGIIRTKYYSCFKHRWKGLNLVNDIDGVSIPRLLAITIHPMSWIHFFISPLVSVWRSNDELLFFNRINNGLSRQLSRWDLSRTRKLINVYLLCAFLECQSVNAVESRCSKSGNTWKKISALNHPWAIQRAVEIVSIGCFF